MNRPGPESGSALLLCAIAMTGLLFLAFALFTVAQAASVRNGGQTAADAAAVGAARADRAAFFDGFIDALDDDDEWREWIAGRGDIVAEGCEEAGHFAGRNDSNVEGCRPVQRRGDLGYAVDVRTRFDSGSSIIPGAGNKTAKASATAVIVPKCEADDDDSDQIILSCDGEEIAIDPDDDDLDANPADLFDVVLVG